MTPRRVRVQSMTHWEFLGCHRYMTHQPRLCSHKSDHWPFDQLPLQSKFLAVYCTLEQYQQSLSQERALALCKATKELSKNVGLACWTIRLNIRSCQCFESCFRSFWQGPCSFWNWEQTFRYQVYLLSKTLKKWTCSDCRQWANLKRQTYFWLQVLRFLWDKLDWVRFQTHHPPQICRQSLEFDTWTLRKQEFHFLWKTYHRPHCPGIFGGNAITKAHELLQHVCSQQSSSLHPSISSCLTPAWRLKQTSWWIHLAIHHLSSKTHQNSRPWFDHTLLALRWNFISQIAIQNSE